MTMDDTANLASLDANIVKRIIGQSNELLGELRVISRGWNTSVSEYLSHSKLGPLERVYVYSGMQHDDDEDDMPSSRYTSLNAQMVAILPEKYSNNVGVGEWLSIYTTHTADQIEVVCTPQRSEIIGEEGNKKKDDEAEGKEESTEKRSKSAELVQLPHGFAIVATAEIPAGAILDPLTLEVVSQPVETAETAETVETSSPGLLLCLFIPCTAILSCLSFSLLGWNLLGVVFIASLVHNSLTEENTKKINPKGDGQDKNPAVGLDIPPQTANEKEKEKKHFPQIGRFIGMFSRIETFVLTSIYCTEDKFGNAIRETLRESNVTIDRLEVKLYDINNDKQTYIVDFCREFSVRHLFISCSTVKAKNFPEFAKQLVAMDITVDIYEKDGQNLSYLNKSRLFWERMEANLAADQVSMRMITQDDPTFGNGGYPQHVTVHIQCQKPSANQQPLAPIPIKRGINIGDD